VGLFDVLFGKTKPAKTKVDPLFAMTTAHVTLLTRYDLKPTGKAAVAFRPVSSSFFDEARKELEDLLHVGEKTSGTAYTLSTDEFGYIWVLLEDLEFEDLVTGVYQVSETLKDHGFQDRLLAAVFPFAPEGGGDKLYWIYAYKHGAFYPFAPRGDRQRDNALELRQSAVMNEELPVLQDKTQWFAFWGLPL